MGSIYGGTLVSFGQSQSHPCLRHSAGSDTVSTVSSILSVLNFLFFCVDCIRTAVFLSRYDTASRHSTPRTSRNRRCHWRLSSTNLRRQTKPVLCQRNCQRNSQVEPSNSSRLVMVTNQCAKSQRPTANRVSTCISHGRRVSRLENSRRLHSHSECLVKGFSCLRLAL